MRDIDRRTALGVGLGAALSVVAGSSESAIAAVGDETKLADGVTVKILGEGASMVPGYEKVRLRDITFQPRSTFPARPMMNAMVCHVAEGELQIDQGDKKFTSKKGDVWTCKIGTVEGASNTGSTVAVMRIADLLPT